MEFMLESRFFYGSNYDYWKTRMSVHLKAMSRKILRIVDDGYVILDAKNLTAQDEENELLNDQVVNMLFSALHVSEFNRVNNRTTAKAIWLNEFAMKKEESMAEMFNWLNDIVNELKGLGFEVPDVDFSHKFFRSLP